MPNIRTVYDCLHCGQGHRTGEPCPHTHPAVKRTEAHIRARSTLPEHLHAHFDALVDDYRFQAFVLIGRATIHYGILACLVREGWRKDPDAPGKDILREEVR